MPDDEESQKKKEKYLPILLQYFCSILLPPVVIKSALIYDIYIDRSSTMRLQKSYFLACILQSISAVVMWITILSYHKAFFIVTINYNFFDPLVQLCMFFYMAWLKLYLLFECTSFLFQKC